MGAMKEIDASSYDWLEENGWPHALTVESVIGLLRDYARLAGPHELASSQHYLVNGKQLLIDIELAGSPVLAMIWQHPKTRRWTTVGLFEILGGSPASVVEQLGWERLPGSSEWRGTLTAV